MARINEICCRIKFWSGNKGRYFSFLLFLCLQIVVFGVVFMYIFHYPESKVFGNIPWKSNIFWNTDMTIRNEYSELEVNKTVGELYFIPERRKTLYVWREGGAKPVKPTNMLFAGKERYLMTHDSCSKAGNQTKYRATDFLGYTDCRSLRKEIDQVHAYVFKEELDMPIAFSILVYKDYKMIELLLRTIYKPHNTYCIHIDAKSPKTYRNRVAKLANCFENVVIATKIYDVNWGKFSIVEAEMSCMTELINKTRTWKYFINLTGQEFPLKTNYEIAKILGALRGFNNIGCHRNFLHDRLKVSGQPPFGLNVYKGPTHVVLTREFVEFVLNNEKAQAVIKWSQNLRIPDEMVFQILNCNEKLQSPGSFGAPPSLFNQSKNYISRFKVWRDNSTMASKCHGKYVRDICIFGTHDIANLHTRHELFANKFHINRFPEVSYCLRNILLKRTILEYKGRIDFNVSFYNNIPYKF